MPQIEKSEAFLLRLRAQDTPTGVSATTVDLLIRQTGLNRTELVHYALRQLADRYLPKYPLDDGALTAKEYESIRAASSASNTDDALFTEQLL